MTASRLSTSALWSIVAWLVVAPSLLRAQEPNVETPTPDPLPAANPTLPVESEADSEEGEPQPITTDDRVIEVTGTRLLDEPFLQPYAFYRHDRDVLDNSIGRTALDRINYGPGVFIQHTAPNQTSPFIRGLTGEQTLLLIDGVRLSHAYMRPGPNQYAALVPDASLQSVDVILGSSSVVNGSDGLTGAIDFNLADAGRGVDSPLSAWLSSRVDSANGGLIQAGLDGNTENWAYSIEFDGRDYHDRVGGADFESNVFGLDTNQNDEIPNTAYEQIAAGLRASYFGFESHRVDVKVGHTRQTDAPRPDGFFANTNDPSRVSRRFDPQTFTYVHLKDTWEVQSGWIDQLRTTVWWHEHYEEQKREQIQNLGDPDVRYRRREFEDGLDAYGLDLQATTYLGRNDQHEVTWGFTGILENTTNRFQEFRTADGVTDASTATAFEPQNWDNRTTVSDDSDYNSFGLFVQDSWDLTDRLNILAGARFSYYEWDFGDVDDDTSEATGSLRGLYRIADDQNVFVGLSRGFRAPNLTNLDGAVDRGSSGSPAVGNPDLDPEISYTAEGGWRWQRERDEVGVSAFYTIVDDLIQRDFGGSGEFTNVEEARLWGFESLWDVGIPCSSIGVDGRLAFVGTASYVRARRDIPQPGGGTSTDNLSRANRFYGRVGTKYEHDRNWWGLAQVRWHDTYDEIADDPSDSDANDLRLTVPGSADGSLPGYGVFDVQMGWRSDDGNRAVSVFVENILDKTYREPGSGADGPGRNIGVSVNLRF